MTDNYMIINGTRYSVINAWTEVEAPDGRRRWGVVTEGEQQEEPSYHDVHPLEPPPRYLIQDGERYRQIGGHWVLDAEEQPSGARATAPQNPDADGES